ncbi:tRNA (carboxymethyluridine(34)-5-O)-methyltransferase ALKBH8 [Cochliomyia hominivorax]
MSHNYKIKKLNKKQKRCEAIIQNDCKIFASKGEPSKYVAILNAGLSTGLTEEVVLETAENYGQIKRLLMLPNKSYCFLECAHINDAVSIVDNMHGLAQIGQNNAVVYLSYFLELPKLEYSSWLKPLPNGLIILNDFITENEESALLKSIEMDDVSFDSVLKHRKVKHYGYEFLYGVNNVNPKQKLDRDIPTECIFLWKRLKSICEEERLSIQWQEPDQLTVNSYEAGQGNVVMEFRKGLEKCPVMLPQRSLMIMSGESRYDWTHGITPRMLDIVPSANGNLTTRRRTKRTSLTFRKLGSGLCSCKYPTLCDSKLNKTFPNSAQCIASDKAILLEEINVHRVYDNIAEHFSETRHSQWPRVAEFLKSFQQSSILLDVGCGNGKYLNSNADLLKIGCDRSNGLLKLCNSLQYNVFRCDCLHVPVRSNSIDGCISIAVIHHLATADRRLGAIKELVRILKPSGRGLIYVWAKNQISDNKKSSYLRQNKSINKNKTTEEELRQQTNRQLEEKAKEAPVSLPIHSNRTTFQQQDVLVPWKVKIPQEENNQDKETYLRYYHVFEENELDELLQGTGDVKIIESYYDQGNHCCIFEKINFTTE